MPSLTQFGPIAFAGALFCAFDVSAQILSTQANLPQFSAFYNLHHTLLAGMAEQNCISLNRDFCLKIGVRTVNTQEMASTATAWITGSYRINDTVQVGLTLDPGIYERLPDIFDTGNRRPSMAGFANIQYGDVIQTRLTMAYSSSTPKYAQDELSRYRTELSTQTTGVVSGVEVAYQQPTGLGFMQPYLHLYYSRISQRDYAFATYVHTEMSAVTARTGFRTIYAFNDWAHLSFNLHVERDLRTTMQLQQPHIDHTDVYAASNRNHNNVRFGTSLGGRVIIGAQSELTAFFSQFTQTFGSRVGIGGSLYFLQRF